MPVDDPRLSELLGSLSLATDVAAGLGPETALRTALLAVRIADLAGLQGFERRDAYYAGVLRFIGCTAFSHEMAWTYGAGDDLAVMRALTPSDARHPGDALARAVAGMNPRAPLGARARSVLRIASDPRTASKMAAAHCDLAVRLAGRLGMSEGVVATLGQVYERWDGRGAPAGLRGDAIRKAARVQHVAWRLSAHFALEGPGRARALLTERAGSELDPQLTRQVDRAFPEIVRGMNEPSVWEAYLEAEPAPALRVPGGRVPSIAQAFAHYVDIKSPFTLGHSTAVAALVKAAGGSDDLHIAALLHDLGRVAVPNGIWDKPGPLSSAERETVNTHVYNTERILARAPVLAPYARLASLHHERLDGGGYHRGVPASSLDREARLLAAADVYAALTEDRAHRPAHTADHAARVLSDEARAGRLDRDACQAILAAAGHRRPRVDSAWPAGLSDREVDVLRLVARGLANKEIGVRLFISAKTVQRHMESIFDKTAVRTRAAAAVFAVDRGLT